MDAKYIETNTRLGAYTALAGSASFIIGAAIWAASGADLDLALANDEVSNYLLVSGEVRPLLIANLSFWIVGALLLGAAATALTNLCGRRPAIAQIALMCYRTGVPLVIVAYTAWLALVVQIAPEASPAAVLLAEALGWFATHADWIATILILGIGPTLISLAGREDWAPTWLFRLSIATAAAGLLTAIALFTGALSTYGFLIIPVGLSWMISAGVVLFRRIGVTQSSRSGVDISHVSKEIL